MIIEKIEESTIREMPFEKLFAGHGVMFRSGKYSLEISPHGRGMLFNKQSGEILTLNVTGAFIATMLQKPADIQVIIRQFAKHFELTEEAAGEDVLEFLEELRKLDLLDEGLSI